MVPALNQYLKKLVSDDYKSSFHLKPIYLCICTLCVLHIALLHHYAVRRLLSIRGGAAVHFSINTYTVKEQMFSVQRKKKKKHFISYI